MAKYKCNNCEETKNVINGICPKCGPTQTTAIDEDAKKESGYYVAEEEKKAKAAAEAKVEEGEIVK